MADSRKERRGSYAKGVAKREEILERALAVIASEGYRGASVKVLAEAVGLSQAGLLHYFDSKEELFTEIVRKRDEVDMRHYGPEYALGTWEVGGPTTHVRDVAGVEPEDFLTIARRYVGGRSQRDPQYPVSSGLEHNLTKY